MLRAMRTPWRFGLDLLLPLRCAGCGAPEVGWCVTCAASLARTPFRVDREATAHGPPLYALAHYLGPARRAVLGYKERGRRDLAGPLGRALATALTALPESGPGPKPDPRAEPRAGPPDPDRTWYLVPAASRRAAARRRGGPHVTTLARHAAAALAGRGHHAAVAPALRLDGRVRDSVGLDAAERAANLRGRLRHLPDGLPPPGAAVTLLDDVITTGATAAACTHALTRAGLRVAAVLAIVATG